MEVKCFYQAGSIQGICEQYQDDGVLWEKCTYRDNNRDGVCLSYRPDGSLQEQAFYRKGEKIPDGVGMADFQIFEKLPADADLETAQARVRAVEAENLILRRRIVDLEHRLKAISDNRQHKRA